MELEQNIYVGRTICSFLIVLLLMPLGHALMILMEHFLSTDALHYSAFAMGAVGMLIVIAGVFVRGNTAATVMGLAGGLLFWTGWVEFLFAYYAWRYGVHCDLVGSGTVETLTNYADGVGVTHQFLINGQPLTDIDPATVKELRGSRPEYLILPATFGLWAMLMMLYTLCTRTGCAFFTWIQRTLRLPDHIHFRPLTHVTSMVTFLELNVMMWTVYLVLMFCYDPIFFGSDHWVTFAVGIAALISSIFMLRKQLRIRPLGANLRYSIATVIIFWTFVEVIARRGILREIWVDPLNHVPEMTVTLIALLLLCGVLALKRFRIKPHTSSR